MNDHIIKKGSVYTRAWEIISKDDSIPPEEKKAILRLIQVLVETRERSREPQPQPQNQSEESQGITQEVISQHSLIATIKHQADELDALKRISLNLTSSLDLQKVLDAVVTEAMGLVRNAMGVHIFLYERGELEFGSSLDMNGVRNKPISIPRRDGLTYSVVKTGRQIIIDDMPNHPIYQTMQIYNSGSIIGIPLKFKDEIVGVMNLSRSVKGRFSRSELRLMSLLWRSSTPACTNA
jgi:transcriptional regulator with GAF, ATPase, and Fis domain